MENEIIYKQRRHDICRLIYEIAKNKNVTHDAIAQKTGFKRNNVSRMLSGRYPPSLDNFLRLIEAVGTTMEELGRLAKT